MCIRDSFYVSFPLALAAAIGLEGGETVQWELLDGGELHLVRPVTPWVHRPAGILLQAKGHLALPLDLG